MKFLDNYLKKRIIELDEHPELNKNGKISQEQAEKYFKYFVVFLLLATFIELTHLNMDKSILTLFYKF